MVSTGSMEATRAGVQILERGGNAVDAAVAVAFALGVADPGGSGLGGMTYVLISPPNGPAIAIDGSAIVPLAADAATLLQLRNSGEHMGAKAVAVPATVAALSHALERYGTMRLEEVLQPSIEIADRGFRLSSNTVAWTSGYFDEILASRLPSIRRARRWRKTRIGGRSHMPPGSRRNPATPRRRGPGLLLPRKHREPIVRDLRTLGGYLQAVDLSQVRARELQPLRSRYRDAEIISYPWPGGGGEVAETLNVLQTFSRDFLDKDSVSRLHVMIEAFRIAHSDHSLFGHNAAGRIGGDRLPVRRTRPRACFADHTRSAIPEDVLGTGRLSRENGRAHNARVRG